MPVINSTTARNNFFKVMEEVIKSHESVIITGEKGNVVMVQCFPYFLPKSKNTCQTKDYE